MSELALETYVQKTILLCNSIIGHNRRIIFEAIAGEYFIHLLELISEFAVTELTEGFKIGFLIYLPFIMIDVIVSNIL